MPKNTNDYLVQLRDEMAKTYDLEELKALAFELSLDWDELTGSRKTNRVQDLITQLGRDGRLQALVELLQKERQGSSWPSVPPEEQQKQDIRTAFPKKPLYQQTWVWASAIVLLAVIGISITTWIGRRTTDRINQLPNELAAAIPTDTPIPTPTLTPTPSPTPLPFLPATEDETLIVIATFYRAEGLLQNAEVHNEIRRAIQANIDELDLGNNVQVKVEPTILRTENRDEAETLGNRYNATLIIWGEETSARLEVSFLNLKEPDYLSAEATISETENTQIASIANPDAYSGFVIEELPGQLSFLSFFALGQTAYSQENIEGAIELIETAVSAIPDLSQTNTSDIGIDDAYISLGWLYDTTGFPDAAIDAYDQAIALNPDSAVAYYNRGVISYNLGEQDQALDDFDQAIALNPEYANAFNNRGVIYLNLKKFEQAIADFDQALLLGPELAQVFNNRGIGYSRLGEFEQGLVNFDQAIVLNPEYANAFNNRGNAYLEMGMYDQAITEYDQVIALNPEYASAFNNRGLVHQKLGEYELALGDFQTYITINPQSAYAPAWNNVCWYGSLLGFAEDVAFACDKVISLTTDTQEKAIYLDSRGLNKALRGDFVGAISDYQAFIDFFQDTPNFEPYIEQRTSWINSLTANQNPFDAETLEALLNE